MTHAYCCPNCKTNRTRFNIIDQQATSVKIDANTGEILETYTEKTMEPFHLAYKGPAYKVQCGVCGLLEVEQTFVQYGIYVQGTDVTKLSGG